ncbi:MAG: hypothetical protein PWR19_410 [Carnobacterium sp.]|nr:hypothetical protein [Carnobacterium sp.]
MSGRLSHLTWGGLSNDKTIVVTTNRQKSAEVIVVKNVAKDRTIFIQSIDWRLEDTLTTENNRMVGSLQRDKVEPKEYVDV